MKWGDDYIAINAIGEQIAAFRNADETALVVGFGTHSGSPEWRSDTLTVTVTKGGFTATSEANRLGDAALMARGKVNRMIEVDRVKKEKEKAEKEAKKEARG